MEWNIQIPSSITDETHYAATLFFLNWAFDLEDFISFFHFLIPGPPVFGWISCGLIWFWWDTTSPSLQKARMAGVISCGAAAKQAHVYLPHAWISHIESLVSPNEREITDLSFGKLNILMG